MLNASKLWAAAFAVVLLAAGWQYRRANNALSMHAAAIERLSAAEKAAYSITQKHNATLLRLHAANAALVHQTDTLATALARVEGDLDAILQTNGTWANTRVPAAVVERLRDYARSATSTND